MVKFYSSSRFISSVTLSVVCCLQLVCVRRSTIPWSTCWGRAQPVLSTRESYSRHPSRFNTQTNIVVCFPPPLSVDVLCPPSVEVICPPSVDVICPPSVDVIHPPIVDFICPLVLTSFDPLVLTSFVPLVL